MRAFKHMASGLLAVAVGLGLALPALASGNKAEKVQLKDCPEAVQKTIKAQAGDGQILEIEKEVKKDGTVVYEAEVKQTDGKKIDVEVAADGKLLKTEQDDENDDQEDNGKDNDPQ